MNHLVQITARDYLESEQPPDVIIPEEERVWCLVVFKSGSPMTLCTGEVFGLGEGNAEYIEKEVKRGGITCPECLKFIREIKAVKL